MEDRSAGRGIYVRLCFRFRAGVRLRASRRPVANSNDGMQNLVRDATKRTERLLSHEVSELSPLVAAIPFNVFMDDAELITLPD